VELRHRQGMVGDEGPASGRRHLHALMLLLLLSLSVTRTRVYQILKSARKSRRGISPGHLQTLAKPKRKHIYIVMAGCASLYFVKATAGLYMILAPLAL